MTGARDLRLLRVPHLRAAHRTLARVTSETDPDACAIVVPTRQAGRELRRTITRLRERGLVGGTPALPAPPLPLLLTRVELYDEWHRRLPAGAPPLLGPLAREAIALDAARQVIATGSAPPFRLRPGLVRQIVALYDGVRRHGRTIEDFERVVLGALEPGADIDRGAARLLQQTRFLAEVFRRYETALDGPDAFDEHRLRLRLLAAPARRPLHHLVLAVADQAAEPDGLWPADFDLLTRIPLLRRVDVVATEQALDAGLRERLFERLPGIEEEACDAVQEAAPALVVPEDRFPARWHVRRDREEEVSAIAATACSARHAVAAEDTLVVYQRPLPYISVARRIFDDAGLPWTTLDTTPLAAEPYVAAVDLLCEAALGAGAREPLLRLLESPVLTWRTGGRPLARRDLGVLRRWWSAHRVSAGTLVRAVHEHPPHDRAEAARLRRAAAAAALAAGALARFTEPQPAAEHLAALHDVLVRRQARWPAAEEDDRLDRARAGTLAVIDELARVHARPDAVPVGFSEAVTLLQGALALHTFGETAERGGVRLCDARAARFADAETVWIVGVNEGEWPPAAQRNVFYPAGLLRDLGFGRDQDRQRFARAAFRDLLTLARSRVAISIFQLEDDAIVRPSVLLEELDEAGPERVETQPPASAPADQDGPAAGPGGPAGLPAGRPRAGWDWRAAHPAGDERRFHGEAGAPPARVLSVTQIDRYLACPFKFFASVVLGLEEEPERDEVFLDPRRRGTLVHESFQIFFEQWTAGGGGAIAADDLPRARTLFAEVVGGVLSRIDPADALVERERLLGSAGAPGLGERVFRLEAVRPRVVVERLLEFDLRGTYDVGREAPSVVSLKGVADRIDLLADGTLRLIDYKTGRAPHPRKSLQLAVYAICAEQKLRGYRGRDWRAGEAAYLALADPRPWVTVLASADDRAPLEHARDRLLDVLDAIGRGSFPPAPADRRLCRSCGYAAVCRKDYVDVA
jgi:RecB family exonuclease/inactivated superfamily I helicase